MALESFPEGDSKTVSGGGLGRADLVAAMVCVVVGLGLSLLPNLLWWRQFGVPFWIADHDMLLYLAVADRAYAGHLWYLGDPGLAAGGASIYPWLQFIPFIAVAKALGLGTAGVQLVWAVWAGASIALGWYALLRAFLRPGLAAVGTIFLLADIGTVNTWVGVGQFVTAARLLAGHPGTLFDTYPRIAMQWRIITPGASLAFLLAYFVLLVRARRDPSWRRVVASGAAFGLLFHVYFYYWTAAGLALVLALVLEPRRWRAYFHTGWIGGVVGLPALVAGYLLKRSTRPDWLYRTDTFLLIPRTSELLVPKLAAILLVVTLVWVWLRHRDLIVIWVQAAAGMLLLNHQLVTGLQIQNFHYDSYVLAPALAVLVVLLVARTLVGLPRIPRAAAGLLLALGAVHLGLGFWLRDQEAARTRQPAEIGDDLARYRAQYRRAGGPLLVPEAVVAGDEDFLELAAIFEHARPLVHYALGFSPSISDAEMAERAALNAVLRGEGRAAFAARQEGRLEGWGPWSRDPALRDERVAALLAAFDRIAAAPGPALDRFRVRFLAVRSDTPAARRARPGWRTVHEGPTWTIQSRVGRE